MKAVKIYDQKEVDSEHDEIFFVNPMGLTGRPLKRAIERAYRKHNKRFKKA